MAAVKKACGDVLLKVIVESAALDAGAARAGLPGVEAGGAQYVKTSTGFHPSGGASLAAVRTMRETVGDRLGVKASGGIRDTATALAMLEPGRAGSGCPAPARCWTASRRLLNKGLWGGVPRGVRWCCWSDADVDEEVTAPV